MATVLEVIQRLFPRGTNLSPGTSVSEFPIWPPDLFAVASTIVNLSGCYIRPRYATGDLQDCLYTDDATRFGFSTKNFQEEIEGVASYYGRFGTVEMTGPRDTDEGVAEKKRFYEQQSAALAVVQGLWERLLEEPSANLDKVPKRVCDAAVVLMLIADSASQGIGFINEPQFTRPFASLVFDEHSRVANDESPDLLRYLPSSLCLMIPDFELCVQPKSTVPTVGCTLRSLSHHLALLPSAMEVRTQWLFGWAAATEPDYHKPINLLIVPFPYNISGNCFEDAGECVPGQRLWSFFDVRQRWLEHDGHEITVEELGGFLKQLLDAARREVGTVHGVILPELALSSELADGLQRWILENEVDIEILICGVLKTGGRLPANKAKTCLFGRSHSNDGKVVAKKLTDWEQAKHHRWKLDGRQVARYHLGARLTPSAEWWERCGIENRKCYTYLLRPGISVATLICEDLARIDPVQQVIRAIGPNLVIALLMDGPQLEKRWSGRYATVLADDPGSAVLTVTSLGLLRRSMMPGETLPNQIGLWKGAEGETRELCLPSGEHGMVLTLSPRMIRGYSMDGRDDGEATCRLEAYRNSKRPGSRAP
ncbi:MAG: hypothetical protein QM775_06800 [Pirellulales bacterium]